MPIVHFRVDGRLIHGQVALAWSKMTNPNHIIVANDMVASSPQQQAILRLAAPKQVRLSMQPIDKVIAYLNRGLAPNENVFLLVKDVVDANKLYEGGLTHMDLNIGNMTHKPNATKLSDKLFVTDKELESLNKLIDRGVNCYFQMIPTDSKQDIRPLVKK
ncbi:PTS sugar transporter subunit IIB [Clostridium tarantellae]|uniref:PTS sugar transporter n=1 Tax=Clostridium tarantellae TaxID=39493 RepID=A0A6I1MK15_9CLOT|nr:PTS sugar transporter subunit IIB [Clostridium tarantellae]MPQ43735.1 PTS sugar transporter [Clostridium tarantellae]